MLVLQGTRPKERERERDAYAKRRPAGRGEKPEAGSRSGEERELRAEEEEARGWKEAYTCAAREEGAAISKFDEVRSEKDGVRRGGAV